MAGRYFSYVRYMYLLEAQLFGIDWGLFWFWSTRYK